MDYVPFLEGLGLGAGLIMAIGAQNAFLLKQGIKRQHLLLCAITCVVADVFLITIGVLGFDLLTDVVPRLEKFLRWGGALFLLGYGLRSFYSVFHPHALVASMDAPPRNRLATWLTLLGFTFLNPHTYIDTMLLLGSIGSEYPVIAQRFFIMGAATASAIWFFGLTYGASALSSVFRNPRAWQVFDFFTGCLMIGLGINLVV
jgi:L-lysine exporter family protein LysE/ArgO